MAKHLGYALTLAVITAWPALAAVHPDGAEFQVNVRSDFMQVNPTAAVAADGAALVVWENDQRGLRALIRGVEIDLVANQILAPGQSEGPVLNRREPAMAFLPNGQLLVAWVDERAYLRYSPFIEDRKVEARDVFVGRFTRDGRPVGAPQQVSGSGVAFHVSPQLAVRADGSAVVTWQESEKLGAPGPIAARRLDARGRAVATPFAVSADLTALHPAVAFGREGGFVIAWDGLVGGLQDVFARAFDADGHAAGAALRVNTDVVGRQRRPTVAATPDGGFLVAWQGYESDPVQERIFAQFLDAAGNLAGGQIAVSADEGAAHLAPAMAVLPAGGYLATWLAWSQRGLGIHAVELGADGRPSAAEFWIKTGVVVKSYRRSIAINGAGNAIASWEQVSLKGRRNIGARRLAD